LAFGAFRGLRVEALGANQIQKPINQRQESGDSMQLAPRHVAAVATLGILLLAALVAPAMAGTQAAPEVPDPQYDVKSTTGGASPCIATGAPRCLAGGGIDMTASWIDNETASQLEFHISGPTLGPSNTNVYTYHFHFKVGGTDYDASATIGTISPHPAAPQLGTGAVTPGGVAANASLSGTTLTLIVLRSAIGDPSVGSAITDMYVENFGNPLGQTQNTLTDRAPETGTATSSYNFTSGSGGPQGTPGDADGDLLNDTWEQQNFGGTSAQNATSDPDADGCNNACEFQKGTNPNNPDTDGDGVSDGDEVKAGTDPGRADQGTTTTSGPPTTGPTTSGGPTTTGSTTTTPPDSTGDGGTPMERLSQGFEKGAFNVGYLILACAIGGVVLLLALIGRFGRWRL
jgi:hypothetical protein